MGYGFEDCWRIGEGRKNVLKLYHNILNVCSCLFTKILTYIDLIPISIKSNEDVLFFFFGPFIIWFSYCLGLQKYSQKLIVFQR